LRVSAPADNTAIEQHRWLQSVCDEEPLCITARGDCMAPLITDGARLQVAPARRYYPGDVIVCRAVNGRYRVHRLLGSARWRGRRVFVTRGDNSTQVDGRVGAGDLLGKVCGGECDKRAVNATLYWRGVALARFARFVLSRLLPGRDSLANP
jgi:hypothetical protein